jgi:hypothetical protein
MAEVIDRRAITKHCSPTAEGRGVSFTGTVAVAPVMTMFAKEKMKRRFLCDIIRYGGLRK